MRYLGNKTRMLNNIQKVIQEHYLNHCTLGDLFSGSGAVSDYFKGHFKIIANDFMHYAQIFTQAKVENTTIPVFNTFKSHYQCSPFDYLNQHAQQSHKSGFITQNYSPAGTKSRMFFTVSNAKRIDYIRYELQVLKNKHFINQREFIFLLGSLLESVMGVSNTSGTYGAYFKKWESRAKKPFILRPLSMTNQKLYSKHNIVYSTDTNQLVKHISGDLAYIDTPYTSLQYSSAYNVLETIANGDQPQIHGKTGIRNDAKDKKSAYSNKRHAKYAFEDLLRQLNFKHVLISYSTQSIIPLSELVGIIKKFAINHKVEVHGVNFTQYENGNKAHNNRKGKKPKLKELLIYFDKDLSIYKSPLDYDGSKDNEMDKLTKQMPPHISNFIDCCGGAFNVGGNTVAMNKVYYNDNNKFVYQIVKMLLNKPKSWIISHLKALVTKYHLNSDNKDNYKAFRHAYNQVPINHRSPLMLYALTLFSFQHMIRFNSHGNYNVPIGKYHFNQNTIKKIKRYCTKSPVGKLMNKSFVDIDIHKFDKDTLFYFDPPYIITSAVYNDGKRFKAQWTKQNELQLLHMMDAINKNGQHFMLSNVIKHRGKTNYLLLNWIKKHKYNVQTIGKTGVKYRRVEVVVKNY